MKPLSHRLALSLTLTLLLPGTATWADDQPGVFAKGRTHLTASGGTGYAFNDNYLVLGIGASYFVLDGLSLGLNLETWTSGDPSLNKVTTSVQYTFFQQRLKPYVGAFYKRVYIEGLPDLDAYGGRTGLYFPASHNLYLSGGVVYENYRQCGKALLNDCSDVYPEFGIAFTF